MRKKTGIYGLDELRVKLQNAPEKIRMQELYGALRREATPLRNAARQEAYADVKKPGSRNLWKSIKITRARVKVWRDQIGVWIGPTRVGAVIGDRQAYPFMQLFGSKFYPAKDYMGEAWKKEGANSLAKIDRVGRSHFQRALKRALQ
jgi:hypothetical protein